MHTEMVIVSVHGQAIGSYKSWETAKAAAVFRSLVDGAVVDCRTPWQIWSIGGYRLAPIGGPAAYPFLASITRETIL